MFSNTRSWTVEWGDCDPAGIVFYPRFFAAFDTSTSLLIEAATGMKSAKVMADNGIIGWPMVDVHGEFKAPASFGDRVEIQSRVTRLGRTGFSLAHSLKKDGFVCVEAKKTRVWAAKRADGSPGIEGFPIPEYLALKLSGKSVNT